MGPSFSPLGIGIDLTTNLNRHMNVRASGSFFDLPVHFTTNGFHADAELKLASARASLDIYPFHTGFRISPGVMAYNQNRITGTESIAGGAGFTLNGDTFSSANANTATGAVPVYGTALLNMHATRPAFTITAGWGNPLARKGHWSFPFEAASLSLARRQSTSIWPDGPAAIRLRRSAPTSQISITRSPSRRRTTCRPRLANGRISIR